MKFERLEAVRGFSALYVAVGHTVLARVHGSRWTELFRFGQEAVIVFFVLSGFVIGWTSADRAPTSWFGRYFCKRFVRIYSVLLLALAAMWGIERLEYGRVEPTSARQVAGNLLMLQDFADAKPAVFCSPLFGDTPLWSLHYEWWFYMAFPLVCLLPPNGSRRHVVGLLGVAGAVAYCVTPNIPCRLMMNFTIWWIGVEAARLLKAEGRVTLRALAAPLAYTAACGVPLAVLCVMEHQRGRSLALGLHPVLELRHLWGAVVLMLLAFGWRRMNWFGFRSTVGLCGVLAPISFSLYVIHYRSIAYASYLHGVVPPGLELPLYAVVTVGFCLFAEKVVFPAVRRLM